jgi:hypothetical protein
MTPRAGGPGAGGEFAADCGALDRATSMSGPALSRAAAGGGQLSRAAAAGGGQLMSNARIIQAFALPSVATARPKRAPQD